MELFLTLQENLQAWFVERGALVISLEVMLIAGGALVSGVIHHYLKRGLEQRLGVAGMSGLRQTLLKFGQRLAFPLSVLVVVLLGRMLFQVYGYTTPVLDVLAKLLIALALVRVIVYALRVGIAQGPMLKAWEQIVSTTIWGVAALHLLGLLEPLMKALDSIAFTLGDVRLSALLIMKLVILSALYILLAIWVSGLVDRRLRRSLHLNASIKVGLSKIVKVGLLAIAVLAALTEVGLNLTSLTVFGGALGVGIGFGLQKIVSNFISGFILLGDRSIRPGDIITIGDNFGWVRELRARYIVVRNRDGVETLIPNENLVTSEVINWSYSDLNVRVRIPVQISYHDDPERAMEIMLQAATVNHRVLKDPEPVCRLMEFADSGIALELRIWMMDPEEGIGNIRSDINLAIWRGFKEAGITIPFPQRDVHLHPVAGTSQA
jgi:small-conductance mechanosensitive channel